MCYRTVLCDVLLLVEGGKKQRQTSFSVNNFQSIPKPTMLIIAGIVPWLQLVRLCECYYTVRIEMHTP